ncbi:MAG TPA: DUF2946 family protein [Stenotrophomonas sp.]|jgi:hypothetical protein
MRPFRPLHTAFSWLAFLAMLLMVCAPLVSRWMQSDVRYAELCTTEGLKRVALPGLALSMGSEPAVGMAAQAGHEAMPSSAGSVGQPDEHAGMPAGHDQAACDYCLLAARVLPLLLCLLAVLFCARPGGVLASFAPATLPAAARCAHPVRGPPLYA